MPFVEKEFVVTTKEAECLLSTVPKGSKFALHFRADAKINGAPGMIFPEGLHSYINLSRRHAVELVSRLLSETLEAKGGRIRIVQRSAYGDNYSVYWIG